MLVYEIFKSIQGESTYAGLPCVFVRLAGCNLSCSWCDTPYARVPDEAIEMTIVEVIEKVGGFDCPLVEITGGEPLMQAAFVEEVFVAVKEKYDNMHTALDTSAHGSQRVSNNLLDHTDLPPADIVKKIGAVPTGRQDRPVTPVVINKVSIERTA